MKVVRSQKSCNKLWLALLSFPSTEAILRPTPTFLGTSCETPAPKEFQSNQIDGGVKIKLCLSQSLYYSVVQQVRKPDMTQVTMARQKIFSLHEAWVRYQVSVCWLTYCLPQLPCSCFAWDAQHGCKTHQYAWQKDVHQAPEGLQPAPLCTSAQNWLANLTTWSGATATGICIQLAFQPPCLPAIQSGRG